nr:MAG TPA: hypothetical protein [Caudoviricetes sp.]
MRRDGFDPAHLKACPARTISLTICIHWDNPCYFWTERIPVSCFT